MQLGVLQVPEHQMILRVSAHGGRNKQNFMLCQSCSTRLHCFVRCIFVLRLYCEANHLPPGAVVGFARELSWGALTLLRSVYSAGGP
jgi:hypothetical protein